MTILAKHGMRPKRSIYMHSFATMPASAATQPTHADCAGQSAGGTLRAEPPSSDMRTWAKMHRRMKHNTSASMCLWYARASMGTKCDECQ